VVTLGEPLFDTLTENDVEIVYDSDRVADALEDAEAETRLAVAQALSIGVWLQRGVTEGSCERVCVTRGDKEDDGEAL
jgi:hypothetical protein